eukprot:g13411.t1
MLNARQDAGVAEYFQRLALARYGNFLHGPIELISRNGVYAFRDARDTCFNKLDQMAFGEDFFAKQCWEMIGIKAVPTMERQDLRLLYDDYEWGRSAKHRCDALNPDPMVFHEQQYFGVYHPRKSMETWLECRMQTGVPGIPSQAEMDAAKKLAGPGKPYDMKPVRLYDRFLLSMSSPVAPMFFLCGALLMMAGAVVVAKRKHTQRSLKAAVDTSIEAAEERYVVFLFLAANIVRRSGRDDQGKILGKGSFGVVKRAYVSATMAQRAVKFIAIERMKDRDTVESDTELDEDGLREKLNVLKQEIEIMKMVDHPNIIMLYEIFEDQQYLCLVMELCSGGSLLSRLKFSGHFSEDGTGGDPLGNRRGTGRNWICHRDLKAENVLVSTGEVLDKTLLKVSDFGLSCPFRPKQVLTEKLDMEAEALAAQQLPPDATPLEQRKLLALLKAEVLQRLNGDARSAAPVPPKAGGPTALSAAPVVSPHAAVPAAPHVVSPAQSPHVVSPAQSPAFMDTAGPSTIPPRVPPATAAPATAGASVAAGPPVVPKPPKPQASPGTSAPSSGNSAAPSWKSDPFVLLGDVAWFPAPKKRGMVRPPGEQAQAPPAQPALEEEKEALSFLQRVTMLMGCELTEQMREETGNHKGVGVSCPVSASGPKAMEDLWAAAFSEAARLLMAICGFMCEGSCPPMLRGNVVTRAPYLPAWQGVVPHMVLREWFDGSEATSLLHFYGSSLLRQAFDSADRPKQGLLGGRSTSEGRGFLRSAWRPIFDRYPELLLFRQLLAHFKRRCWEDARDRSRSRSPRRKEQRLPSGKPQEEAGLRFILKKTGNLDEEEITQYFQHFGRVVSCNVLRDKRTKKSRGVAFCTLRPEGFYQGQAITESWPSRRRQRGWSSLQWVKQEKEDDEDKKREERERRRSRVEKEQRQLRTLGGAASLSEKGEERLVSSHWFRRWRQNLWESLPKGTPVVWAEPCVTSLCSAIWSEVAEHAVRMGDRAVQEALMLFQDPTQDGRWSFVPAAELVLTIGEGLVGLTALGLFVWPAWQERLVEDRWDPVPPRSATELALSTKPNFVPTPVPPTGVALAALNAMASVGGAPIPMAVQMGSIPKGSDHLKIFVGGLPHHCTLEMLGNYFSQYGRITDAVVMMDKTTGKPRGFGFVVFEHVSCVEAAIADYGKHAIDGKWIDVKKATPQDPKASDRIDLGAFQLRAEEGAPSPERQGFREGEGVPGVPAAGARPALPVPGLSPTSTESMPPVAVAGGAPVNHFQEVPPPTSSPSPGVVSFQEVPPREASPPGHASPPSFNQVPPPRE